MQRWERTDGDRASRWTLPQMALGLLLIPVFVWLYAYAWPASRPAQARWTEDAFYMRGIVHTYLAQLGGFVICLLLTPALGLWLDRWRSRLTETARRYWTIAAVTAAVVFVSVFLIVCGRHQFGAFDFNILIETGWRQMLGQRPYVDFPTTSPPLFNLGAELAFRLFGVNWNANLYLSAIFASATLIWLFSLLRQLNLRAFAAVAIATSIEIVAMLSCDFWWYNNTTLILAAVVFVSAILLARVPESRLAQVSLVLSSALLLLAKPNVAGLTLGGCWVLLLLVSKRPRLVLVLGVLSAVAALLICAVGHVSLPAMLDAYRAAAKERGAFSRFGYQEMSRGAQRTAQAWLILLSLPLLALLRPLAADLRARQIKSALFWLFFLLAPVVATVAILENGEYTDVEFTLLLAALGILAFGIVPGGVTWPLLRRYTIALIFGMAIADLSVGAERLRVYTVGPHQFFEWEDNNHLVESGFLKDMRISSTLVSVERDVRNAEQSNQGPYFFGPRVDFNYAVLRLPSPRHFPAWWHPGTAFGRAQMPQILSDWEADRFETLIYLKDDYTYYPPEFCALIDKNYVRDESLPTVTVYHRRASAAPALLAGENQLPPRKNFCQP